MEESKSSQSVRVRYNHVIEATNLNEINSKLNREFGTRDDELLRESMNQRVHRVRTAEFCAIHREYERPAT